MTGVSSLTATASSGDKSSNRLYDISYLDDDGANYRGWKYRIQTVLEIQGIWKAIEGTETDDAKIRDAWAQIILTLKDESLNGIIGVQTAKDVWDKLGIQYEGKGIQKVAYLIGELFRSSLSDIEPMEPQINKTHCTARTLQALKNEIKDLPPSYSANHPNVSR